MWSFSTTTATFVHTLPLPSISFPNLRYCVAATAWDASTINATAKSFWLMDVSIVQGSRLVILTRRSGITSKEWTRRLGMVVAFLLDHRRRIVSGCAVFQALIAFGPSKLG